MGKEPKTQFAAIPIRALTDRRLTELHLRTLGIISYHDRMSIPKGAGQGCWASSATMAEEMGGYHLTNVSTAISQLVKWGYILIEKRPGDRRLRVYRVIFEADDDLPHGQTTESANCEDHLPAGKQSQKVVCPREDGNPQNSGIPDSQYISLSEEIDFAEARKLNSAEAAHFSGSSERDYAKAWHGTESIKARLPRNFATLPSGAQLARIEHAFEALDRDADSIDHSEREEISTLLWTICDAFQDDPTGRQAQRLLEEIAIY